MKNYVALLIADLDNTVYNWVDFFAPSFRAMVHALSREMRMEEEILLEDFKGVYGEKGSLEYAFSVQDLTSVRGRPAEEVERLVAIAKGAFSRVREANLRPYLGVKETLLWALQAQVATVAVTNAPIHQAEQRLRHLHLDGSFLGLAAWVGHEIPGNSPLTAMIRDRAERGEYRSKVNVLWPLDKTELKPSALGYRKVMEAIGISGEATYVIGDSLYKDLQPALDVGATPIWARYGAQVEKKNFDTLLRITHWSEDKVAAVYDTQTVQPAFTVDSFEEIKQIIRLPQGKLF